ncbi:gamma-glutamyltranspeptidase [Piedraia hortae CBS 480.64]|uniref:Glutathione hydrolase n=1 Tax=Piedraia hortae CBS 480.64 TaxID=1314780 RepID=A0A6A7C7H2_9PEZI|nr:gamma-glutamyltranspeptidase [Piedraia hortae CBS 480.64]
MRLLLLALLAVVSALPSKRARHGGVASENKMCSRIGADVMRDGGNAADAIVASTLCIGVVSMYHSGIGGGGFVLVRDSKNKTEFIDFRETAPAASTENMYNNNIDASVTGGLAVGVPGELRGLAMLHERHGCLPWKRLVMPAVHLARDGFEVNADLANVMDSKTKSLGYDFLVNDPSWAIDFAPNGTRVGLGDWMTRKRYSDTLEDVALRGVDAFYTGARARALVAAANATGGIITMADLKNYTVEIREPATIDYRGFRIHSGTAPSSGAVALSVMKIIEGFNGMGRASQINMSTHRLDEAMRFAYGQRAELGDPAFVANMTAFQQYMLSDTIAKSIRAKIQPKTQNVSVYDPPGLESLPTAGTSALVAADDSGLAVALTTTVNLYFGSLVMVPETGVVLNDEMNDFSVPGESNQFGYIPTPNNFIRPGKRPLSSISTTIVEKDGRPFFVTAAAGGSRIITSTVQQLWYVLDYGLTAAEALAKPRLHDQLIPNQVSFEWAYDNSTVADMIARGHNVTWVAPGFSTQQSVKITSNGFEAAGEPRQASSGGAVA